MLRLDRDLLHIKAKHELKKLAKHIEPEILCFCNRRTPVRPNAKKLINSADRV